MYRLFFPEFFPELKRLIYFDADVIVQMDVARLATVAAMRPIQVARLAGESRCVTWQRSAEGTTREQYPLALVTP